MIKIGIIGTNVGSMHAEICNQISAAKVTWICGKDLNKTQKIAADLRIPNVTNNYKEIVKTPDIDLVIIAAPTYLHKEFLLESLKYKKHIVLEKPAGVNSYEVRSMIREVKRQNYKKLIIVDHEMRFNPVVSFIKEKIRSDYLGKITNIYISKYHGSRDGQELYESWEMKKNLGGGQILLAGSHLLDLALFLLDFPEFTRGTVHKRNINKSKRSLKKELLVSDTEDFYRSSMLFGNVNVDLYDNIYGEGHKTMEMKVVGTKSSFIYDDVYGLFENKSIPNATFEKVTIADQYASIKSPGRSLITNSLKFFLAELIKSLENNVPLSNYCTLEESAYGLECYERCEIV